jgi:hypothetical protein
MRVFVMHESGGMAHEFGDGWMGRASASMRSIAAKNPAERIARDMYPLYPRKP